SLGTARQHCSQTGNQTCRMVTRGPERTAMMRSAAEQTEAEPSLWSQLNRITLRFFDAERERRFSEAEVRRVISIIRLSITGGFSVYIYFGILDYIMLPPAER